MVKSFLFARTPKIIFGNGKIAELPGIAKSFGGEVLLVTGAESFSNSKHGEYLMNTFEMTGIRFSHISIVREPSPEMIDQAVVRYSGKNIQLVIAVGGGSAIDAGKAISAMLNKTEQVSEYLEGIGLKDHPGTKVPFIALPTTSGTGSEATKNAVISRIGKAGFKRSLRHDNLVPDIAIIDPELTYHCPPDITAASGMDCFTQLVEAYVSDKSSSFTDAMALEGIRSLTGSLLRAWKWGQDVEARAGMSYAALLSGICLANAGLGTVHGFASSLGGMYNVPHGVVCGTLMATANSINVRRLKETAPNHVALSKYAELGKIVSSVQNKNEEYYIDAFLQHLNEWTSTLTIPRLGKYGVNTADFDKIVSITENKNNPVPLNEENLKEILHARL
jgi:alcohol dehydrogenase class IV